MARYPLQIDVAQLGIGQRVALPERADFISVYNPTAYTLLAGWGSQRIPVGPADADFPFPPAAFTVLPVTSAEFGLVLAQPQLVTQPPGMPTRASVVFYARETPPLLSSIPLTGLTTSVPALLYTSPVQGAGLYDDTFAVPAGVTELWVENTTTSSLLDFSRIGLYQGSNVQLLECNPRGDTLAGIYLQPYVGSWFSGLGALATVHYTQLAVGSQFCVLGVYGAPSYTRGYDGAIAATMARGSRIGLVDSVFNPITSANPLPVNVAPVGAAGALIIPSLSPSGETFSSDITPGLMGASGFRFYLNVTGNPGAGNLGMRIYGKHPTLGTYVLLDDSGFLVPFVNGLYVFEWYPAALTAVAGTVMARRAVVPFATGRVSVTHNPAFTWTYSLAWEPLF